MTAHRFLPDYVLERAALMGARIRYAREQRRWSLERVSKVTGLSIDAIEAVEAGSLQASLDDLTCLLWALGLDASLDEIALSPRTARTREELGLDRWK